MSDENKPKEEQENQEPEPNDNPAPEGEGGGESGQESAGAADSGIDYSTIMNTLKAVQENQAAMSLQIKAISDAQSVLVDNGAVVRELPASQIKPGFSSSDSDDFVSIEDLDLSI